MPDHTRVAVSMALSWMPKVVIADYPDIVFPMMTVLKKINVTTINASTLVQRCHHVVKTQSALFLSILPLVNAYKIVKVILTKNASNMNVPKTPIVQLKRPV